MGTVSILSNKAFMIIFVTVPLESINVHLLKLSTYVCAKSMHSYKMRSVNENHTCNVWFLVCIYKYVRNTVQQVLSAGPNFCKVSISLFSSNICEVIQLLNYLMS